MPLCPTADGADLAELLVRNGFARIYGTRTPLPDGRSSRPYLAHLRELKAEARSPAFRRLGACRAMIHWRLLHRTLPEVAGAGVTQQPQPARGNCLWSTRTVTTVVDSSPILTSDSIPGAGCSIGPFQLIKSLPVVIISVAV